ncbi:MAG TPA: hypothetical protein VFI20_09205, partial [Terracidiphilus sp.]|nr:hypothetical protein [Terracidiphilus sp.]
MRRQWLSLWFRGRHLRLVLVALFATFLFSTVSASAQAPWSAVGPDGGDARALAADPAQPDHLYLGTTNSWIYESTDGGSSWHRLSRLDDHDDLIVDHILVDR